MLKELFKRFVLMRYMMIAFAVCCVLGIVLVLTYVDKLGIFSSDTSIILIIIGVIFVSSLVFVCCAGIFAAILAVGALLGLASTSLKQVKSYRSTKDDAQLRSLEKQRLKVQVVNFIFLLLGLSLFFIHWSLAIIFLFVGYLAFIFPMNKAYRQKFKELLVNPALDEIFTSWKFEPGKTFSAEDVRASNLFRNFKRMSGNDYLDATYGHIAFKQSDIELKGAHASANSDNSLALINNSRDEIFTGRLMMFDFPLYFPLAVRIYDKNFKGGDHKENDIKTELDIFNQRFNVVAQDGISAMRVLTPQVIEGMAKISAEIVTPLAFSFQGNKLYVALAKDDDSFEATTFGDITLLEEQEKVKKEFILICALLDNIYLKKAEADTVK